MYKTLFALSAAFLLSATAFDWRPEVAADHHKTATPTQSAKLFLDSLDADLRQKALFKYEDEQRFNWHFIPRGRRGVAMAELAPKQEDLVKALLGSCLSKTGVRLTGEVRELEGILRAKEGRGRRFPRSPDLYYVSIFGEPGAGKTWTWRFEGHHLSLNFTLEGDRLVSATPYFLGSNPAEVQSGPRKGLRVLGPLEDLALELASSLSDAQLAAALGDPNLQGPEPEEVKGMQSPRYEAALPEGLSIEKLGEEQKELLRKLLGKYVEGLRAETREELRSAAEEAGFDKIRLVWRGGRERGKGHSYIIHGPSFVVSYSNFQNNAGHVHAAVRTRQGEFALTK